MRPLRVFVTGVSALLVSLLVITAASAQSPPRCRDILGGALDVDEIERNSFGQDVLMTSTMTMPSFTTQELLGAGESEAQLVNQTATLNLSSNSSSVSGDSSFLPPVTTTTFTGKSSLTWRKYAYGRRRNILPGTTASYRLLHNGSVVQGFVHETDSSQVLNVTLRPIAPSILCKVRPREFIVEGGVDFEIELRELSRSGEHNVSVEVAVDAP